MLFRFISISIEENYYLLIIRSGAAPSIVVCELYEFRPKWKSPLFERGGLGSGIVVSVGNCDLWGWSGPTYILNRGPID